MNDGHAQLCSSPEWAEHIASTVLPAVVGRLDLGEEVLEIGPGYGASTQMLVESVPRLTVLEVDESLARALATSYPAVEVVHGSGDDLPFADGRFTAVVCFTMLHHVQTRQMQDDLFAQVRRVLRPGGLFAGSDSIASDGLGDFHRDDVYLPVDPPGLPARLRTGGFTEVEVSVPQPDWFTFLARAGTGNR